MQPPGRYSLRQKDKREKDCGPENAGEPERASKPFEFLRLPGEIRNAIYKLVVVSLALINPLVITPHFEKRLLGLAKSVTDQMQPSITMVSRQLRREALPLYYAENTFSLTPVGWPSLSLSMFQNIGNDNLKCLRVIYLGCPFRLTVRINHDNSAFEVSSDSPLTKVHRERANSFFHDMAELTEHEDLCGLHLIKIAAKVHSKKLKFVPERGATRLMEISCCYCHPCQWIRRDPRRGRRY
jgi:hypothetical protein